MTELQEKTRLLNKIYKLMNVLNLENHVQVNYKIAPKEYRDRIEHCQNDWYELNFDKDDKDSMQLCSYWLNNHNGDVENLITCKVPITYHILHEVINDIIKNNRKRLEYELVEKPREQKKEIVFKNSVNKFLGGNFY